ncbi:VPLPA-CTERM sorting domain-containing protein [Roseovarius sp. EGI FJ00037]|uniref:VPLPA-CTERM sorting domain-containing protein n=1 Tax=Roseovarius salincola TaxID=2978479 RepID=UPI0022A7C718|nr:VPLPA-CTERM sorting domain-containing protein [Roseovarius sp. EGI FJ00037]MCZ0810753.1 VPLPA-CTERM sorting domain-containing protein [Roseovarius sp. EGI FJ00037]
MKHRPKNTAVRATIGAAVLIVSGAMAPAATQSFNFGNPTIGGNSPMSQFFAPTQFPGLGGAFAGFGFFPGGATSSYFSGAGMFGGMGGFGAFNQFGTNTVFGMNTQSVQKAKKKNKNKKKKNKNRNKNKVTSKPETKPETKPKLGEFCLSDCKRSRFFEEPTKEEPVIVRDDTGDNYQPGVVPLPAGGPLLIGGLAALALLRRRRKA